MKRWSGTVVVVIFASTANPFFVTVDSVWAAVRPESRETNSINIGGFRIPQEPTLVLRDVGGYAAVFSPGDMSGKSRDLVYRIRSPSDNYFDSGVVALIKAHAGTDLGPMMPQLQVSLDEIPSALMVRWRFDVLYTRPNKRNLPEDEVHIPATGFKELPGAEPWKLFERYKDGPFFGGNATLTFQICTADGKNCVPKDFYHYRFRIGGQNPIEELATKYIDKTAAGLAAQKKAPVMWYASAVAKSETKYEGGVKPDKDGTKPAPYYNQFLPRGYKGDPDVPPDKPETFKPNWHNDGKKDNGQRKAGGFGIFQVTGDAINSDANVPRKVIWNWQDNVAAGLQILLAKQKDARSWLNEQKQMNPPAVPPVRVMLKHDMEVIFADGTPRTIADIIAIKGYNGSSYPKDGWKDPGPEPKPEVFYYTNEIPLKGRYVYYCAERQRWCLSRFNAWKDPFNYVERVCLEVEPLKKP
jgi:hypothetical protein